MARLFQQVRTCMRASEWMRAFRQRAQPLKRDREGAAEFRGILLAIALIDEMAGTSAAPSSDSRLIVV